MAQQHVLWYLYNKPCAKYEHLQQVRSRNRKLSRSSSESSPRSWATCTDRLCASLASCSPPSPDTIRMNTFSSEAWTTENSATFNSFLVFSSKAWNASANRSADFSDDFDSS